MLNEIIENKMKEKNILIENCVWIKIEDNDMAQSLWKEDIVLIDKSQKEIDAFKLYAVRINGNIVVRKIFLDLNKNYRTLSGNSTEMQKKIDILDLIGRVILIIREA